MYIISSKTGGEMWLKGIKIKGNIKATKKRVERERNWKKERFSKGCILEWLYHVQ